MSEYKPITYELREMISCFMGFTDFEKSKFIQVCDNIDSIHSALEAEYEQYRDGWVELPKDADGEPVRIGDVMENIVCPPVHREVTGVGVECFYGWDDGNGRYSQFSADRYRHHHDPTVVDVLREFANEVYADADNEIRDRDFLCAKYAKRLALAGDAE